MKKKVIYSFLIISFQIMSLSLMKAQSIFINELSICNTSNELDPNYDYSGWIELYNATNNDIQLKYLYYSDEPGKTTKYKLNVLRTLPAKGYASIWINDEISDGKTFSLDTDADGGYLSISNSNGIILDEINYPVQHTNVSWGRTTDGGNTFGYFIKSTHNQSNNSSATASIVVAEPTFSLKGGFYPAPVSVSIQCKTEEAKIFYTLDGSYPTPKKNLYTGTPIQIDSTIPLRAKAFADGYLDGTIATATYMIHERKPDLPVVFITTDTVNLYNDTIGIYCIGTNGSLVPGINLYANYARDWTRPAHLEYLDKNKTNCLDQAIGISISGNASIKNDQKSFKINSGKKYGKNRFDYPLFSEREGRRFKSFLLRNGGQMNGPGFLKDPLLQTMTNVINEDHQAFEISAVYINGLYWGILSIRERHNKDYIYSNYGYSDTEIDFIENNYREQVSCGDMEAYNTMKELITTGNLSNDSIYEKVKKLIDIDSYIYYMAVEIYVHNNDWPTNNQMLFRKKIDGKFRWILQDLDKGFSSNEGNKLKDLINSKSTSFPLKMITYLLQNELFKEQYINSQCLVAGSVFNPSRGERMLDSIQSELDSEWQPHAERWGFTNQWSNLFHTTNAAYKLRFYFLRDAIYSNLAENFNLNQPLILKITSNEISAKLTFNDLEIPILPYDGKYFKDKDLKLTAPEYVNGKKFQFWDISKDGVITNEHKRSFTLSLSDAKTTVNAIYDQSDSVRRGGLYINEVSASNAIFVDNLYKYEDWIEIYNASNNDINLAGICISNDANNLELFQFKDTDSIKTTIPANGHTIIWCSKKPERGVIHTNFKLDKQGGTLFLSKKDINGVMQVIDSLSYTPHSDYSSFGRYPDGDAAMYIFERPTFNTSNIATSYNTLIHNQDYNLIYGLDGLTPPIVSNMLINNGRQMTTDSLVSISFKTSESAVFYRLSESPDFKDASWKFINDNITFKLSPEYDLKTIFLQVKNALYSSTIISEQIIYLEENFRVVVGFNGNSSKNVTETVDEYLLNSVSLSLKDSYSALQLYDIWGNPTMKLAKKLSELNRTMRKYGISKGVYKTSSAYNPILTGDLGVYPDRYYSVAYFFGPDSAVTNETRRLIAGFIDVPNGIYDVRILASLSKETKPSDYLTYRYQVNNSDIYIPDSDIFYNNQNNYIEFKNVKIEDSVLLVCSWREPYGVRWGNYAPINLIEISESGTIAGSQLISERENFNIYSGKGKITVESENQTPFTIYGIDGMIVKQVVPESESTEIYVSPGVYIIRGKKAIAY